MGSGDDVERSSALLFVAVATVGGRQRSVVRLAYLYPLLRDDSSCGDGGGDREAGSEVSGRPMCRFRRRRPVVTAAVVAFIPSLPTAAATARGSRADEAGEWEAEMRLSGRRHCCLWRRRSVVPLA